MTVVAKWENYKDVNLLCPGGELRTSQWANPRTYLAETGCKVCVGPKKSTLECLQTFKDPVTNKLLWIQPPSPPQLYQLSTDFLAKFGEPFSGCETCANLILANPTIRLTLGFSVPNPESYAGGIVVGASCQLQMVFHPCKFLTLLPQVFDPNPPRVMGAIVINFQGITGGIQALYGLHVQGVDEQFDISQNLIFNLYRAWVTGGNFCGYGIGVIPAGLFPDTIQLFSS